MREGKKWEVRKVESERERESEGGAGLGHGGQSKAVGGAEVGGHPRKDGGVGAEPAVLVLLTHRLRRRLRATEKERLG